MLKKIFRKKFKNIKPFFDYPCQYSENDKKKDLNIVDRKSIINAKSKYDDKEYEKWLITKKL